mmetsp:Transcript_26764/g.74814  ORF Transcript_26764/g.74814 Transcript_26764/m.74814 type:complete len:203 (-) Transcript_26764:49-657(-)
MMSTLQLQALLFEHTCHSLLPSFLEMVAVHLLDVHPLAQIRRHNQTHPLGLLLDHPSVEVTAGRQHQRLRLHSALADHPVTPQPLLVLGQRRVEPQTTRHLLLRYPRDRCRLGMNLLQNLRAHVHLDLVHHLSPAHQHRRELDDLFLPRHGGSIPRALKIQYKDKVLLTASTYVCHCGHKHTAFLSYDIFHNLCSPRREIFT